MAKLIVLDERNDSRVPFLRGILAKSLQEAGLDFDEAYRLASDIRDGFEHVEEITTSDLRKRILGVLEKGQNAVLVVLEIGRGTVGSFQ